MNDIQDHISIEEVDQPHKDYNVHISQAAIDLSRVQADTLCRGVGGDKEARVFREILWGEITEKFREKYPEASPMGVGVDIDEYLDEKCELCGSQTKSHTVPMGYFCHSCFKEHGEEDIVQAVDSEVYTGGHIECHWCRYRAPVTKESVKLLHQEVFNNYNILVYSCKWCSNASDYFVGMELFDAMADTSMGERHPQPMKENVREITEAWSDSE